MDVLASRVLLRPTDFDAATDFYERQLGLSRFREWGRRPHRGVVYFCGGAHIELAETGTEEVGAAPARVRLWLQVPDAQAAHAALRNRGAQPLDEPDRKPWGLVEFHLKDPDGLELVIVEVPADHPLRRDTRGD